MRTFGFFLSLTLIFIRIDETFSRLKKSVSAIAIHNSDSTHQNFTSSFPLQVQSNFSNRMVSLSLKPINRIIPFYKWRPPGTIDPDFIFPPSPYVKPQMKIIKPELNIDPDMVIKPHQMGKKKLNKKNRPGRCATRIKAQICS